MNTSIRDMKASDADLVVDYFANADPDYLKGMGADKSKLPDRTEWIEKIIAEINY